MSPAQQTEFLKGLERKFENLKPIGTFDTEYKFEAARRGFMQGRSEAYFEENILSFALFYGLEAANYGFHQFAFGMALRAGVEATLSRFGQSVISVPKAYSGHVPLGSTDLSRLAIEYRIGTGMLLLDPSRAKNVAVLEYELGGVVKTVVAHNKGSKHSERVVKQLLPKGANPTRLYTERAPCTNGVAPCAPFIAKDFPGVPVTYSFDYATNTKKANEAATYMIEILKAQYRIK
jgi:hypothetical protein